MDYRMNSKNSKLPGRKSSSIRSVPGRAAVQSVRKLSEVGVSLGALKREEDTNRYPDTDRGSVLHMADFVMNDVNKIKTNDIFEELEEMSEVKITKICVTQESGGTSNDGAESKLERAAAFFSLRKK